MAENIKIEIDLDAGSSLKTMGELESSVESMMDELKKTDVASDRFKELSSAIANSTSKIKDMELGFEGLDMEQKSSEMGSFAAGMADTATGALALGGALGITSKSSEKMIESLVSGMAVAQTFRGGLDGIISAQKLLRNTTVSSTVAQKALNLVMKANPLVLLISLITSAVGALAIWNATSDDGAKSTEELTEEMNNLNKAYEDNIQLLERLANEDNIEEDLRNRSEKVRINTLILEQENKLAELKRKEVPNVNAIIAVEKELGNLRTQLTAENVDHQLRSFDILSKAEDKRYKEVNNLIKEVDTTTEEGVSLYQKLDDERTALFDKYLTRNKRRVILEKELLLDFEKTQSNSSNRVADLRAQNHIKTSKNLQELGTMAVRVAERVGGAAESVATSLVSSVSSIEQFIELRDMMDIQDPMTDLELVESEYEQRNLIIQQKLADGIINKEQFNRLEVMNEKKKADEIIDIEKKKAEEKREIASQTIRVISQGMDAVASLMQTSNQAEIEAAEGNEAKQKKLRKEGFEQQKKFQIASAVMGMAQGIISGLGAPYPMNIAMPIIAGVTGAAQIAKIASTTFTGGGGGGSTPTPSVSTAAPNIRETPGVNLFGQGNEGSEGDSSQFNSQEQGQPNQIQAVVSWSDIDAVQNNDNNIQQEMQL